MRKKYTIQINVDAYLKFDIYAISNEDALDKARRKFSNMPIEKIRTMLNDVELIRECFIDSAEPCEVEIGGEMWKVIEGAHIAKTPLIGFSDTEDIAKDDWKVMDIAEGELWMNNNAGYTYIVSEREGLTYARFF